MYEGRKFVGGLLAAGLMAAGCAKPAPKQPEPIDMPAISTMQVACMEVEGLPFPEQDCADLAEKVRTGIDRFSDLTQNKLGRTAVTHHRYPEVLPIKDARARRCTSFQLIPGEKPGENFDKVEAFLKELVDGAKRVIPSDVVSSGVYMAFNASLDMCPDKRPAVPQTEKPKTEKCPTQEEWPFYYPGGRALPHEGPAIFSFTGLSLAEEAVHVAHERTHLGRGKVRIGHEFVLCNKKADELPPVIRQYEPGLLDLDMESWRGSLMSYSGNTKPHFAPPHLVYLDVISEGRIASDSKPGTYTVYDAYEQGLAAVQLPLSNVAVKSVMDQEISTTHKGVLSGEYRLWLAKRPGHELLEVYAAPKADVGKKIDALPIFLLETVPQGGDFKVEGDFAITDVVSRNADSITFSLQSGKN